MAWLWVEESGEAFGEGSGVVGLAFPDGENSIGKGTQLSTSAPVAIAVALELGEPVAAMGSGDAAAATGVHVPEAAVDVDDFVAGGEDEVGGAGERAEVEAEAEAEGVDEAADDHFRGRVLGFDGGHDAGTLGLGKGVRHLRTDFGCSVPVCLQ